MLRKLIPKIQLRSRQVFWILLSHQNSCFYNSCKYHFFVIILISVFWQCSDMILSLFCKSCCHLFLFQFFISTLCTVHTLNKFTVSDVTNVRQSLIWKWKILWFLQIFEIFFRLIFAIFDIFAKIYFAKTNEIVETQNLIHITWTFWKINSQNFKHAEINLVKINSLKVVVVLLLSNTSSLIYYVFHEYFKDHKKSLANYEK